MVIPERFATDVAAVGLLASVGSVVNLELLAAGERLVAVLTGIRFLSRVRSHVDHQLTRLHERLAAPL